MKFGTSGWRGIIGKEVTFRNVRIVTSALIDTLREDHAEVDLIVIGYDTRMLSEKFAPRSGRTHRLGRRAGSAGEPGRAVAGARRIGG